MQNNQPVGKGCLYIVIFGLIALTLAAILSDTGGSSNINDTYIMQSQWTKPNKTIFKEIVKIMVKNNINLSSIII
ncbi:MAG TPA: hypothetical protein VKY32_01055 [Flavobacterium sp.]|nr:hypothetical protein [Flavobacterium sp.]